MANRLARATSPYLRQHADNPVDWYEWGPEAFERARREDKPILLSVGYASCHWCHVMAHESFEDPATAELMNRLFVNVKVDREERPDVDALYMEAVQAMTGRGGWPMTVWLTPDGRPFYAGTYFPATDRHGMPSFRRVCLAVAEAWAERRQEVVDQADRLTEAIGRKLPPADRPPTGDQLAEALRLVERTFDPVHGGFGTAPKFPQAPLLEFLLRARRRPWGGEADRMLGVTLERMARGGIFDQLGGGFARYSVDERWLVPHFEKMLYDNAQLARLYMWAGVELGSRHLGWVAEQTFAYMLRDLRHPDGGFYSAEDADSEGVEGEFYVWSHQEFVEVVGDPAEPICEYFGVTPEGNFEGRNVLSRPVEVAELAARWGWETEDLVRPWRRPGRSCSRPGPGGCGPAWTTRW
ncbi:MAG: hypothetical protein KatS3mg011_0112 [Acidimicrobiia bacterium]|nr:MAG: hypothetical protein KatS3mg011_0112 [Acidimicrobiia bacterium]